MFRFSLVIQRVLNLDIPYDMRTKKESLCDTFCSKYEISSQQKPNKFKTDAVPSLFLRPEGTKISCSSVKGQFHVHVLKSI